MSPEPSESTSAQQAIAKSQRLLRLQSGLEAIVVAAGTANLQVSIERLTQLFHADLGYLVFLDRDAILNVFFVCSDPNQVFRLPFTKSQVPWPQQVDYHQGLAKTYYGGLELAETYSAPFYRGNEVVVGLQIGNLTVKGGRDQLESFRWVCSHLQTPLLAAHDQELSRSTLRQTKNALKQTEKLYNALLNESRDLIVSIDLEGRILNINQPGLQLLGYSPPNAPSHLDMISPDLSFLTTMLQRATALNDIEVVLTTASGDQLFGIASFSGDYDESNSLRSLYGVIKNITDRIQTQRELWKANVELQTSNQLLEQNHVRMVQQEKLASIGQLAAGVAHEINNPLGFVNNNHAVMKTYFDQLIRFIRAAADLPGTDQAAVDALKQRFKIETIIADTENLFVESQEGYDRIINIVKSLKDFSRIDTQGKLSTIDLNAAIESTLVVSKNTWKYSVEIATDWQLRAPVECYGDLINQVLLNLIVNAAQAIESQKRTEPGRIAIRTWEADDQAWVEITDDGPGIPDGIRQRIFEPFFTTKEVGQGTGLGLSITYDIVVNKHQGQISVDNAPAGGARFRVAIPLSQPKLVIEDSEFSPTNG